jgi:hypothetical protein
MISPVEIKTSLVDTDNFSSVPAHVSGEAIKKFQSAFVLLRDAKDDRVLETAIDRYLLGRQRREHHPHHVNQPNWDKIVDYVIAMETLLLTSKEGVFGELSYRLRLNGAALLSRCVSVDVYQLYHVLKHLYELRSKVVHGADDDAIRKFATKFLKQLEFEKVDQMRPMAQFMEVSKIVEAWMRAMFVWLAKLDPKERPYRKLNGWEQWLLGEAATQEPV